MQALLCPVLWLATISFSCNIKKKSQSNTCHQAFCDFFCTHYFSWHWNVAFGSSAFSTDRRSFCFFPQKGLLTCNFPVWCAAACKPTFFSFLSSPNGLQLVYNYDLILLLMMKSSYMYYESNQNYISVNVINTQTVMKTSLSVTFSFCCIFLRVLA